MTELHKKMLELQQKDLGELLKEAEGINYLISYDHRAKDWLPWSEKTGYLFSAHRTFESALRAIILLQEEN